MKVHEFLTKENWIQHNFYRYLPNSKCGYCLVEAIRQCYYGGLCFKQFKKLGDKLGIGETAADIMSWNDAPSRTFDDVHSVLVELDI